VVSTDGKFNNSSRKVVVSSKAIPKSVEELPTERNWIGTPVAIPDGVSVQATVHSAKRTGGVLDVQVSFEAGELGALGVLAARRGQESVAGIGWHVGAQDFEEGLGFSDEECSSA
jgi:hypothetical protein